MVTDGTARSSGISINNHEKVMRSSSSSSSTLYWCKRNNF
jgi:hypothetical protein